MANITILARFRALTSVVMRSFVSVFRRTPTSVIFLISASLAFLIFLSNLGVQSLTSIFLFDGYAADGAFQSLNPLRRLAAGEVIGRDFNFFHGVAIPLIHMPLYYLFGQGLIASEVARWVVSPTFFVGSTFLFFYVFRWRFVFAFAMTAAVTIATMLLVPFLIFPLTSMLGVRSTIPVLLLVLIMVQARFKKSLFKQPRFLLSITWYELLVGLLLALSFISGTEFGVAALLAFFAANTFYMTQNGERFKERLLSSLRTLGLFAVWLTGFLAAITRGNPLEPIKYALVQVPSDQFWYFGASPNKYLHLGNLLRTLFADEKLLIILFLSALTVGALYWLHRLGGRRVYCQAFIFGLLAGLLAMVSMLGYYHYSEAANLARMAFLVGGASLTILFGYWKKPLPLSLAIGKFKLRMRLTPKGALKLAGLVSVVIILMIGTATFSMLKGKYDLIGLTTRIREHVLGQSSDTMGRHWNKVLSEVIPILQADNSVKIADITNGPFAHGIGNSRQVVVDPGERGSFIYAGQVVYLSKSGRQIIEKVEPRDDGLLLLTLEQREESLDQEFDGAPAKMVVAEDFQGDNNRVWSLYGGMLEHETGLLHPAEEGYDYIIHALSRDRRQQYLDDFKQVKPRYVVTLSRPYFVYDEWIQNAHWDLYSLVNNNYEVIKESSIYIVWQRRDQPWVENEEYKWQKLSVNEQEKRIDLPEPSFENVPDIQEYIQSQKRGERERKSKMGIGMQAETCIPLKDHRQLSGEESGAKYNYYMWREENSGPETNAKESREWGQATANNPAVMVPGRPPVPSACVVRPKRQVILVRLEYEASHPLEALPVFGDTTRFLVEPNNTFDQTIISLRPYSNHVIFPLVISELNQDPYLRLNANSILPGAPNFRIIDAAWTPLDVTSIPNLKTLTESHE